MLIKIKDQFNALKQTYGELITHWIRQLSVLLSVLFCTTDESLKGHFKKGLV